MPRNCIPLLLTLALAICSTQAQATSPTNWRSEARAICTSLFATKLPEAINELPPPPQSTEEKSQRDWFAHRIEVLAAVSAQANRELAVIRVSARQRRAYRRMLNLDRSINVTRPGRVAKALRAAMSDQQLERLTSGQETATARLADEFRALGLSRCVSSTDPR